METMTVLSRSQFESAMKITNTKDAAAALLHYQHFRTLGDVLRSFCDHADVKNTLVDGLLVWFPESKRDAMDKKVRNWLAGKNQNIAKENLFILCHILELDLEKTNQFLKMTSGEGIHWRNPDDIVWTYAIAHHLPPDRTYSLLKRAADCRPADKKQPEVSNVYTAAVYENLQSVFYGPEEGLLDFIAEQRENLGTFHNTAYQTFLRYMTLLEDGFANDDIEKLFPEITQKEKKKEEADASDRRETARKEAEEAAKKAGIPFVPKDPGKPKTLADLEGGVKLYQPESITTREVLEVYLYRNLIPTRADKSGKATDPFFAIRQSVRQNWPDEATISKMKSRQIDIDRKVLILLFLATDGSNSDYGDYEDYEEDEAYTQEDAFLDIYTRLNLMLCDCGFLKLDPRSAFDWIVLFCISTGDLWDSDERIQTMLLEMFPKEN